MASCLPRSLVEDLIRKIATEETLKDKREARIDIWKISDEDVQNMIDTQSMNDMDLVENLDSKPIQSKLDSNLKYTKETVAPFVKKLNEAGNLRHSAIALDVILESVKGEIDKAHGLDIDPATLSSNGVTPALPLHRMAATIGRRILYLKGYTVTNVEPNTPASEEIEALNYDAGMKIINGLAEQGFFEIHESGQKTIKDYLENINDKRSYDRKNVTVTDNPSIDINLDAFDLEADSKSTSEQNALKYFTNRQASDITTHNLGDYVQVLKAINLVSQPQPISLPATESGGGKHKHDVGHDDPTFSAARKELNDHHVKIDETLHEMYRQLHEATKLAGNSASTKVAKLLSNNRGLISALFKVDQNNEVVAMNESQRGKNLSSATPLDDLVEYFGEFADKGKKIFLNMFRGRNGRLYVDNSVLNPHSSKLMRHTLSVDPYTMDTDSEVYAFYVGKVAYVLGIDPSELLGDTRNKGLDSALKAFDRFAEAKTLAAKMSALSHMHDFAPGMDFAELVTVMKAAKGVRDSKGQAQLTTTYATSSDATASGGMLTLLQALGSNPLIANLLKDLGILKGEGKKLDDVYAILQSKLDMYIEEGRLDEESTSIKPAEAREGQAQEVMRLSKKVLFKNVRDMSKKPTMTFIYGQGRGGALRDIAQDMTERLLKQVDARNAEALPIINELLETNYTKADWYTLLDDQQIKANLIGAFERSGAPGMMYDILTDALTSKYLLEFDERADAVMKLLERYPELQDMKVLPASAAIHFAGKPVTKAMLEKYGVPLQKIHEVRKQTYNAPVLTRQGKLQKTIMGVSLIHTADSSIIYRALKGLLNKHNSGAIVVHDDIRSSAHVVMEAEKRYVEETLNYAQNFDIHEQVLLAAAQYSENVTKDARYDKLMKNVEETKRAKAEALEEFDLETTSIIGDPIKPLPESTKPAAPAAGQTTVARDTQSKPQSAPKELLDAATDSSIVTEFLNSANQAKVKVGDNAKFSPATDTITIPRGVKGEKAVELAEHEIVHSYTSAVIQQYYQDGGIKGVNPLTDKQSKLDVAYIEKALKKLQSMTPKDFNKINADPRTISKMMAFANYDTPEGVAELVSVLSAEPAVAASIYGALNTSGQGRLAQVVQRIVDRIREVLSKVTYSDLESKDIDVEKLYGAVNATIQTGKTMRETEIDTVLELQEGFGDLYSNEGRRDDHPAFVVTRYIDALNSSIARRINDPAIRQSGKGLKKVDDLMKTYVPAYKMARDKMAGLYEKSSGLQQLMHTITNENINKELKNELLSAGQKIRVEKNEVVSIHLTQFGKETAKMNKAQKKAFYDFVHRMPLHDYFMLAETVTDIDTRVDELAKEFSNDQRKALDGIVDLRVNEKSDTDTKYSVSQIFDPNGQKGTLAREYIVLRTISEIGESKWDDFKSNEDLFNHVKDVSLANAALNSNIESEMLGDILVRDEPKEPKLIMAVKKQDMWKYSDEERSGWKVLQTPEGRRPGIVYRETIDQTHMEGAFTDAKLYSADVDVGEDMRSMEGVVKTPDGYKLVLNTKQKTDMGVFNDAEQGLVRSMAHAAALQDSQNIRDRLLQRDTYFDLDRRKEGELITMINDPETDHPWFLSAGTPYEDLPKAVQNKYKPVGDRLSNMDGFNTKIGYVRKDIEQWLTGRTEKSLTNNPYLKWATRITKHAVAGAKIGMVILNPMKILDDNISNVAYLGVRGVDPLFMQKQYRQISKEFHDYQQMKNKLNHLRVKGYAAKEGDTVKKQIAKLEGQLKKHPANGLVERGFINSLGSDLVLRAGDPASGMKSDIDKVLTALFKSKDGDNNAAGRLIMKLANWNVGIDEFLEIFAKIPGAVDSTKNFEKEVNTIARRLKDVKTQDDVVSYMHQYLNSPDSEFVKMGTYMTDLSDVLAKETYYRYLTARGWDSKKAEIEVIDSFPDYKENLPTRVKQLSDVGILMFPSYWLRIQKAIYRMIRDKPVSFGTELSIEAALGVDTPTIFDANIISKAAGNYGLLHTPWEHVGMNSLFPTQII